MSFGVHIGQRYVRIITYGRSDRVTLIRPMFNFSYSGSVSYHLGIVLDVINGNWI